MQYTVVTPVKWFEDNGIKDYEIVMSNPWKGRKCYVFRDKDGKKFFLKWNDTEDSYTAHLEQMEKEERIYRVLQTTDIAPKYQGGGMFITECIEEGVTLRKKIKELLSQDDEDGIVRLVQETLLKWKEFRIIMVEHDNLVTVSDSLKSFDNYLMSLMVSGPIETKWSLFMRYRNRVLLELFRWRYKNKVSKLTINQKREIIHGDFHANNVVIDRSGKVFLLDFENAQTGIADIELAYMVAQLHNLLKVKCSIVKRIDSMLEEHELINDSSVFGSIMDIYDKAISWNPRFS